MSVDLISSELGLRAYHDSSFFCLFFCAFFRLEYLLESAIVEGRFCLWLCGTLLAEEMIERLLVKEDGSGLGD